MPLQYHPKATIQPKSNYLLFENQVAVINWKEKSSKLPVCLVTCDSTSRLEFGPGCFRAGKGEMIAEFIIKIDQRTMTAYFVDNELYTNEGLIQWEPVKLSKLIICNQELFEQAFR
jgi:hypothetical protein